ncbi:MAG: hypothetical protein ACTIKP_05110, partial [Brevibacterium aurantiacum]
MTLTPDRKRDKQNRRDDPASSAAPVGESTAEESHETRTYRELLREAGFDLDGHPLADRFDEVATPPPDDFEFADAEHPLESSEPTENDTLTEPAAPDEPGASADSTESVEPGAPTSAVESSEDELRERWVGRNPWQASADDPDARAELKRRAAEIDAEKEAWMHRKDEGAEAERSDGDGGTGTSEDDDWATSLDGEE